VPEGNAPRVPPQRQRCWHAFDRHFPPPRAPVALGRVRELSKQRRLRNADQGRGRIGALLLHETRRRHAVLPAAQNAGQAARDEMGVDGFRCAQFQCTAHLSRVERAEHEVVGASVEGTVIRGEALHHVDVAAEQQQECRTAGEETIPRCLQGAVERLVLFSKPGHLIEDNDRRRVR
jgi:hypothetical protein